MFGFGDSNIAAETAMCDTSPLPFENQGTEPEVMPGPSSGDICHEYSLMDKFLEVIGSCLTTGRSNYLPYTDPSMIMPLPLFACDASRLY